MYRKTRTRANLASPNLGSEHGEESFFACGNKSYDWVSKVSVRRECELLFFGPGPSGGEPRV